MAGERMHIFLDLWGVLLDEVKMNEEYNALASEKLASWFGGDLSAWREAYDSAWANYLFKLAEAEKRREDWLAVADRLDSSLILDTFRKVGSEWRQREILSFARDLENQVASFVAVAHSEVKDVLDRLHKGGHEIHVATQAGEWNARGALQGSGLIDQIDRIFSGSSQRAFKSDPAYWRGIPKAVRVKGARSVLVDDRRDYLKAARSVGFVAVLLDRNRKRSKRKADEFLFATMSSLSELPPFIESLTQKKMLART